ncbi:MAG: TIGR03905 family TSCPD domain-containing protein [Synergistaceae bacterium]|nr:TIGR03905 family TSCPD domain-containing protein [Synergistaceae bacterium]
MREHYEFQTEGVCAKLITFDIEDGRIYSLNFLGGCNGNLKAIAKLVEGSDAALTAEILRGNTCGHRMTSCADQLAQAIEQAIGLSEHRIAS